MLQVSSITAITIVGLLISLLIVFCGMGIFWAWRRIKLQNNSMFLLNQAQSMAQQRAETLQNWLQERMGLKQATIDGIMAKHLEQEAQFFESMQHNMVEQNMATAQQLNQSFDQLQNLLKEIDPGLDPEQVSPGQSTSEEIERLTQQNQTLTTELSIVKQTMDSVISEYARIFNLQEDENEMLASKELIFTLLTGTVSQLGGAQLNPEQAAGTVPVDGTAPEASNISSDDPTGVEVSDESATYSDQSGDAGAPAPAPETTSAPLAEPPKTN